MKSVYNDLSSEASGLYVQVPLVHGDSTGNTMQGNRKCPYIQVVPKAGLAIHTAAAYFPFSVKREQNV